MSGKMTSLSIVALLALLLGASGPASAQEDDWEQTITFYGWLSGADGTVGVGPTDVQIDFSVGDAWDALSNVTKVFMAHYEGTRGRWRLIADYSNLELQGGATTAAGPVTVDFAQRFAELCGTYSLSERARECKTGDLTVLAGLRYADISTSFEGTLGGSSGSQSWVDALIGLDGYSRLSDRWQFGGRGDIGGFGIGSSSDLVWNLILRMTYDASNLWHFSGGWRWLDYDYETGSGTSRFAYDVTLSGPFFGATYSF